MESLKDKFYSLVQDSGFNINQLDFNVLNLNEKIYAMFLSVRYTLNFINSNLLPEYKKYLPDDRESKTINSIFLRIYCQIKSFTKLNEITDFQSISFIARSILELYVDMHLIMNKSLEYYMEKYYSYQKIKLLSISKNQSFAGYIDDVLSDQDNPAREYFKDNKDKIDEIILKYWGTDKNGNLLNPKHWSGLDLFSRIEKLKNVIKTFKELKSFYFNIVPYCNMYIHSDPSGILNKTEEFYFVYVYNLSSHVYSMINSVLKLFSDFLNINSKLKNYEIKLDDIKFSNTYFLTKGVIDKLKKGNS